MSPSNDPYSFHKPRSIDYVDDAFQKLRLTEAEMPTFYALLANAVIPPKDETASENWQDRAFATMNEAINTIQLARTHAAPYFNLVNTMPEQVMCAAVMLNWRYQGYESMRAMLENPAHEYTILLAHRLHAELKMLTPTQPNGPEGMTFSAYTPFLQELKGVLLTVKALRLALLKPPASVEALARAMGDVNPYRPMLEKRDSSLAVYFKSINRILDEHRPRLKQAVPNAPAERVIIPFRRNAPRPL